MPNKKEHKLMGAGVGALFLGLCNVIDQVKKINNDPSREFNFLELSLWCLGGGVAGAVGAMLPDLLEPANCPRHRSLFHSVATGALICKGMRKLSESSMPEEQKQVVVAVGIAYLSHLAMDADTPAGLPVIM